MNTIPTDDASDRIAETLVSDRPEASPHIHVVRAGDHCSRSKSEPEPSDHRPFVEPWLSALFQAEHLSLLVGSGFTTAVATAADSQTVDLQPVGIEAGFADCVREAAKLGAQRIGRGQPNLEDQARAIMELISGLNVLALRTVTGEPAGPSRDCAAELLDEWTGQLDQALSSLLKAILATERGIHEVLSAEAQTERSENIRRLLAGFLLPFSSRPPTRDRTHIFTTNYDRLIEYASDLIGLRIIDRFVGALAPVFRSSRLGVDLHYNPPGIRGEPRYLEGVVRLTKLHGSVDWRSVGGPSGLHEVQRVALPFGADDDHPDLPVHSSDRLLVYPNAAKDVETLLFPYADLFRDFAAAVCRPNAVIVTYGFGFGDDHVNRVLRDAVTIPSTHLVVISYDDAGGRLNQFLQSVGRDSQVTLLVGPHFGDLSKLVDHYLPKPAIDRTTWRMATLLDRRTPPRLARPRSGSDRPVKVEGNESSE